MRVRGAAITLGLLWSALTAAVALAHLVRPGYGVAFLAVLASLHPSYRIDGGLQSVVMLAVLSAVDAAALGFAGAWIYERATRSPVV